MKEKTMKTITTRMGYAVLILAGLSACTQVPAGIGAQDPFRQGAVYQAAPVPAVSVQNTANVQTLASGDLHFQ